MIKPSQPRSVDDVEVVTIAGRLTIDAGTALHDAVSAAVRNGRRKVVVNLDATDLDAAGLGEIVRAYAMVRHSDGEMKLAVRRPLLRELLVRTKLVEVLDTFSSEAEAIASFILPLCDA